MQTTTKQCFSKIVQTLLPWIYTRASKTFGYPKSNNTTQQNSPILNDTNSITMRSRVNVTEVATEVAASISVLETLARQLREVAKDVETSVAGVCEGFEGLSNHAQQAMAAATGALQGLGTNASSENELIDQVRGTLDELLHLVKDSSDFAVRLSGDLNHSNQQVSAVEKSLDNVETIAEFAKVVALNGRIEAARASKNTAAFTTVAEETKTFADQALLLSREVRQSVTELSSSIQTACTQLRAQSVEGTRAKEKSEAVVEQTLQKLSSTHFRMVDSLGALSKLSHEVQLDVGRAVMAMQFQDRVSQRIEHVVQTLAMLSETLRPITSHADPSKAHLKAEEWHSQLSRSYTMDAEREIHATHPGKQIAESTVELF